MINWIGQSQLNMSTIIHIYMYIYISIWPTKVTNKLTILYELAISVVFFHFHEYLSNINIRIFWKKKKKKLLLKSYINKTQVTTIHWIGKKKIYFFVKFLLLWNHYCLPNSNHHKRHILTLKVGDRPLKLMRFFFIAPTIMFTWNCWNGWNKILNFFCF